jgi:hypothetical protein
VDTNVFAAIFGGAAAVKASVDLYALRHMQTALV